MGIIQKILTKMGDLLSGEPDTNKSAPEPQGNAGEEKPKNEEPQTQKLLLNSVEVRKKIKKSTLTLLNSLYLANPDSCKTKHLIVWLDTDTITFNSYADFGQELEDYWAVESGYAFEKVELRQGKPDNEQDARKVDVDINAVVVYLQEKVEGRVSYSIAKRARVSVFAGKGSLVKEQYELSSEMLGKESRKCYNIGRGEFPDVGGGSYRQNHIAIDDKCNLEANKFVSRTHAHIGYSDKIGFYLQVEYGGSRLSGNRTRIFRGEDKIEVESVEVKEPLLDGDLIELGKAVVLEFVEIK